MRLERLRKAWPSLRQAWCLADTLGGHHIDDMFNILSILIGLVALLFAIPGIVPFFGWINYFAIMVGVLGLVIGMISSRNTGRNLNIVVLVVAAVRLSLGGGFF